ncbi:asparagine synthase (glutamine-hydrolyzing) [Catellatospora coxensis]|uniref:asparagine synthase (glutamine-hydrolyzing) n=1 Tax=Catellatospora coxensis TaxID=310354 RepID=UPI0019440A7A|nr:asparagine synthase (glutamine-hydrolyzing) [Catellatospora coxensis]
MCGILAYFSSDGCAGARVDPIAESLQRLHHRGPDDTGVVLIDGDAVFGHKRLAVIDPAGSQEPLYYRDDRYVLTFNGEIYNYLELREELRRDCGAEFRTDGDAEVIVAGYHYWGETVLDRLRGMFAFVIWDRQARQAFGARDQFGIKPMYLLEDRDGLYLASEKKALLPFLAGTLAGPQGIDPASLKYFMTYQYVPEPRTLDVGVERLAAAECFTWTPAQGMRRRRYLRTRFAPMAEPAPQRLYEQIAETLRDSVRMHLRSDVPVGAFLSSGIDSTAIVALAREVHPDLKTFTVGFDIAGYSETEVARESAELLGVRSTATTVTAEEVMAALPRIVWHLDDPVADPSLVPLYFLARTAARDVTVVLSGEGADELFGGYTIYREPLSLRPLTSLPDPVQRGLRAVSRAIPEGVKGRGFLERGTKPLRERFNGNARIFTDGGELARLLPGDDGAARFTDVTAPLYEQAAAAGLDDSTAMQFVDLHTWLPGDILTKADRMSMAHSLELRVPFLDREVFEVARRIPLELKLPRHSPGVTKHALRQALRRIVPPTIVDRPKMGFPTPTRVWLAGPMYHWARHVLHTSGAGALIDLSYVDGLLQAHRAGEADHSRKVWTVLTFCLWHAVFVTGTLDPGVGGQLAPAGTGPVESRMTSSGVSSTWSASS